MNKEELEALEKIADGTDDEESRDALRKLGIYYYNGGSDGWHWLAAIRYYLKAAKKGDFLAQVYIGDMFYEGNANEHIPQEHGYAYMFYYMASQTDYWNFQIDKKNDAANNAVRKLYEAREEEDLQSQLDGLTKFLTKGQIQAYVILAEEFQKHGVFTYTAEAL